MKFAVVMFALFVSHAAAAQPLALPPQPPVEFRPTIGHALPLDAVLLDEHDRPATLGQFFGKGPVVLVLGYYRCPNLCATIMDGILQALTIVRVTDYQVVAVSIDPRDSGASASRKKQAYADAHSQWLSRLHLLHGDAQPIARIARAAGFEYAYDAQHDQYVHPAGFLIASADGRITRYFPGVVADARDLRLALVEAARGHAGSVTDRLTLLCSHYDPSAGRYTVEIMAIVRVVCLLALAVFAVWLMRRIRRGERP
ncbi:MAG: SCO family protein [Rhodospirillaceae bacterium]